MFIKSGRTLQKNVLSSTFLRQFAGGRTALLALNLREIPESRDEWTFCSLDRGSPSLSANSSEICHEKQPSNSHLANLGVTKTAVSGFPPMPALCTFIAVVGDPMLAIEGKRLRAVKHWVKQESGFFPSTRHLPFRVKTRSFVFWVPQPQRLLPQSLHHKRRLGTPKLPCLSVL